MKKTYTRPEIEVSKFDVETVVTASVNLEAGIYANTDLNAVAVVDYTTIFGVEGNN